MDKKRHNMDKNEPFLVKDMYLGFLSSNIYVTLKFINLSNSYRFNYLTYYNLNIIKMYYKSISTILKIIFNSSITITLGL